MVHLAWNKCTGNVMLVHLPIYLPKHVHLAAYAGMQALEETVRAMFSTAIPHVLPGEHGYEKWKTPHVTVSLSLSEGDMVLWQHGGSNNLRKTAVNPSMRDHQDQQWEPTTQQAFNEAMRIVCYRKLLGTS